ncbi:MAG: chemotaxis-specific protein-glutamate methyltransferase CheB [Chloroflexota bacterium]
MNLPTHTPIRVLIVDDSALIRTILAEMLNGLPDIEVAGEAKNGQEAVRMTLRLQPHVITMDIRMPVLDGLEATRHIMSVKPTPIVVIASSTQSAEINPAFNAIQAGALMVIEKPRGLETQDYETVRKQLIAAVRSMASVQVVPHYATAVHVKGVGPRTAMLHSFIDRPIQAVVIGASTGGPPTLQQIFSNLPDDFSIPIVVVQHIMPAFLPGLLEWLRVTSKLPMRIAQDHERILPGTILFAPGDAHLLLSPGSVVRLDTCAPIQGQRPSATRLFQSAAATFGGDAVGVILTGMGEDGVDGLVQMGEKGAHIIAQDQASSVVFGMPRAAIARGVVDEVLAPDQIALRLKKLHWHTQALLNRAKR